MILSQSTTDESDREHSEDKPQVVDALPTIHDANLLTVTVRRFGMEMAAESSLLRIGRTKCSSHSGPFSAGTVVFSIFLNTIPSKVRRCGGSSYRIAGLAPGCTY